jgi:DNA-binding NarL/FixJ family response regulator
MGEEILEKVRTEKLPTRVIVVTGLSDRKRLAPVVRLRPEGLLMKPISPDVLERLCGELESRGTKVPLNWRTCLAAVAIITVLAIIVAVGLVAALAPM